MHLPSDFLTRMKGELKEEFVEFLASYDKKPYSALRVNTLKISAEELLKTVDFCTKQVAWCNEGFYYDGKRGSHIAHRAGLFYSQEPSAMITAEVAGIEKGDFVLDLCAAPGGKSTQVAAKLNGSGLLVSNEVNSTRAKILCENIERLGIKNAVVTNMYPEKMEGLFKGFFDKIIVDAPCSGEGMFRKDATAVDEWSIEHTHACADRQLAILKSAEKMLKSGGIVVYSTCTFAKCENEDVCDRFTVEVPSMELLEMHRMFPHKIAGEGHFCAKFKKTGEAEKLERREITPAKKETISLYRAFENENLNICLDGAFVSFGDFLYNVPSKIGSLDGIKCIRPGLQLGEIRKGRFVPSHHLCVALKKDDFKRKIELSDKQCESYLKGEAIFCDTEKGYGAAIYKGKYPIGWYKYSDGCAKNHYPKYLRG